MVPIGSRIKFEPRVFLQSNIDLQPPTLKHTYKHMNKIALHTQKNKNTIN